MGDAELLLSRGGVCGWLRGTRSRLRCATTESGSDLSVALLVLGAFRLELTKLCVQIAGALQVSGFGVLVRQQFHQFPNAAALSRVIVKIKNQLQRSRIMSFLDRS